jgi:hypothetical protein
MHWLMLLYSRRWVSALSGSVRGRISELIERVTVRGPMQSFKSASQEPFIRFASRSRHVFVGHSYDRARDRVHHSLLLLGPHSGH